MMLSHAQRRERRKQIAEYCRTHTAAQASVQFRCSTQPVYDSCKEHGVVPRLAEGHGDSTRFSTLKMLAALFDTGQTYEQIAERFNATLQRVGKLYNDCRRAGIPLPDRPKGSKPGRKYKHWKKRPAD